MNTEEQLQQRIARLGDRELIQTMFLFERVEAIDVSMRDMMAAVFPTQILPEKGIDIMALLRAELRRRILAKSAS